MTQRTINLYDGLEALYYFDSDYFDGTTGELKDKSGHGRHATANGGPTVGVNGPNDFKAASFDGTDDFFGSSFGFGTHHQEFTVAVLVQYRELSNSAGIFNIDDDGTWLNYREAFDDWEWSVRDEDGTFKAGNANINVAPYENTWEVLTGGFDPIDSSSGEFFLKSHTTQNQNREELNRTLQQYSNSVQINQDRDYDGSIAFAALWTRVLTDAEREYIGNLTAPLRAQL
jgi:hypothetical protein